MLQTKCQFGINIVATCLTSSLSLSCCPTTAVAINAVPHLLSWQRTYIMKAFFRVKEAVNGIYI